MKSSISKKLLKAFKGSKKDKSPQKHATQRKSQQYSEMPRKFSNDKFSSNSIPEQYRCEFIAKDKISRK